MNYLNIMSTVLLILLCTGWDSLPTIGKIIVSVATTTFIILSEIVEQWVRDDIKSLEKRVKELEKEIKK